MTPEQREYLLGLDPATLLPSPEVDALVAKVWMGLNHVDITLAGNCISRGRGIVSPSTNPAHAGEARRVADGAVMQHGFGGVMVTVISRVVGEAFVQFNETNGDKGRAEALAITRAIVAAMQAREKRDGN